MAFGRSGAPKLTDGGAKEREEHGELGSGLTGARAAAWRPGGRGEEKGAVRCGVLRGSSGGFYRAGGGRRGGGRSNGGGE
jgi:hypothetical protein